VQYDEKQTPYITDPQSNAKQRIWFIDGPPTTAAPDTEGPPEAYQGENGVKLKELYDHVRTTGTFKDNFMPEIPPKREWISFEV
jgi:nucleoporin NUP42